MGPKPSYRVLMASLIAVVAFAFTAARSSAPDTSAPDTNPAKVAEGSA